MRRPEEVKLEFTREWVSKAESDFKAAAFLLKSGGDYLFQIAFHAPFGVDYRYPGDYPDVTPEDAEKAVTLASRVRDEIRNRLPDQSLDL